MCFFFVAFWKYTANERMSHVIVVGFHRIREHRQLMRRNLYTINPVLAQMLEMWQSHYVSKHFISTDELSQDGKAFDLAEFTVS